MITNEYKGSCLCGGITFSVAGFSELAANCHCTMCRKFHGAAFSTMVEVTDLKWLSGENLLKVFSSPNGTKRCFCSNCGSSLGFLSKGQSMSNIEISIAAVDTDIPVKADAHIYTNYKACWYLINDGLPVYKEHRQGDT